jgi:hypothetical protein
MALYAVINIPESKTAVLYQQTALPPPFKNVVLQVGLVVKEKHSMVTDAQLLSGLNQHLLKLHDFRLPPQSI